MATAQEHKAAIDAAMDAYKVAEAEADQKIAAAKVQAQAVIEAAGAALAEGEIRSLDGDVRIIQKKNGKVSYKIIQALEGGS